MPSRSQAQIGITGCIGSIKLSGLEMAATFAELRRSGRGGEGEGGGQGGGWGAQRTVAAEDAARAGYGS